VKSFSSIALSNTFEAKKPMPIRKISVGSGGGDNRDLPESED
jgi:hypothetical protein